MLNEYVSVMTGLILYDQDIERIIEERKDEIVERWQQHHGNR